MGLTRNSTGRQAAGIFPGTRDASAQEKRIALAGNPNVGKSTLFNALTGMKQHTGNWPGKTVSVAAGHCRSTLYSCLLVDLPGTYSLMAHSPEEEIARDFLCFGGADAAVVVCDASCLERSLNLALQTLELVPRVLICVNLMDEAERRRLRLNLPRLSSALGVPVIGTSAHNRTSVRDLAEALDLLMEHPQASLARPLSYPAPLEAALQLLEPQLRRQIGGRLPERWLALRLLEGDPELEEKISAFLGLHLSADPAVQSALEDAGNLLKAAGIPREQLQDIVTAALFQRAEALCRETVSPLSPDTQKNFPPRDLLTSRAFGYPFMLLLLALVFWLTLAGANLPSRLLSDLLFKVQDLLTCFFIRIHAPAWLHGVLVLGAYRVLAWVVSVMLPPMAVFFPLFTLLEDAGFLPRIAYNLDHAFQRCGSCGKQALTMCMGFGCNAAGVTGCRIIDSPRERLIAILTNSLVPCNGRFPMLIALITMFFAGNGGGLSSSLSGALLLTGAVLFSVGMTFSASWLLSRTILKGLPSFFTLELPPYRKPRLGKVLIRSVFDRTLFVLGRAVCTAAPAGILIWLMANLSLGSSSLLNCCAGFLDPFASLFGLDGVILMAFILGFPANEIVIPILLMAYLGQGILSEPESLPALKELLAGQGWTWVTAACTLAFSLFHWPCSTTLITIYHETKSLRWTLLSFAFPTALGLILCFLISRTAGLFF